MPPVGKSGHLKGTGTDADSARGKIRRGNVAHQLAGAHLRVFHQGNRAIDHLAEIVRRNVRGQADRDARSAVDQKIGKPAGQQHGFFLRIIEIELEIHSILFDVAQHFNGKGSHARLGVAHGGRAIAVHGAEIAVPIHQRRAHHKGLRKAHQCVVYRSVAVRMVFAQAIAHDARALAVRLIRRKAQFLHGVENAALHGLESVLHARQGALQDDVLGIGQHGITHHILHGFLHDFFQPRLHILRLPRHLPHLPPARNRPPC